MVRGMAYSRSGKIFYFGILQKYYNAFRLHVNITFISIDLQFDQSKKF